MFVVVSIFSFICKKTKKLFNIYNKTKMSEQ